MEKKDYIEVAAYYLERRGYEVLEREWKCEAGTADIVARCGDILAFAEVQGGDDAERGFPPEGISAEKRERFERAAAAFLRGYDESDALVRFDVVSIIAYGADRAFIRHHQNAYGRD